MVHGFLYIGNRMDEQRKTKRRFDKIKRKSFVFHLKWIFLFFFMFVFIKIRKENDYRLICVMNDRKEPEAYDMVFVEI